MKKILIYIVLLLIGLMVMYSTLCYFGSKELYVTSEKTMKAPGLMVFNQVNDFNNWKNWSSWNMMDSTITTSISDIESGSGAQYSWSGGDRSGKITIDESVKASLIKMTFTSDSNDNKTFGHWNIKALTNEKTKVELIFKGEKEIPFFMRGYRLLTGSSFRMRSGLDKDLESIAKLVEEQYKSNIYNGYKIELSEQEEQHFVIKRDNVIREDIQQFYAQNLGSLFQSLQNNKVEMNGLPCGLYFQRDMKSNQVDMAAGIPVKEELSFDGMSSYTIPASKYLEIQYYGNYKQIHLAHNALNSYLNDHNIYTNPPMLETYITDPGEEKDASKWLTEIRYYYSD